MIARRLPLLTDRQARGEQCAWCRASFSSATPSVAVPGVVSIRGTTVNACAPPRPCAAQLGHQGAAVTS